MKNIFDTLLEVGHDEDFVPIVTEDFRPTDAPAGSPTKLEVLEERIRNGMPLWHPEDRADFIGLTGTMRPRDTSWQQLLMVYTITCWKVDVLSAHFGHFVVKTGLLQIL